MLGRNGGMLVLVALAGCPKADPGAAVGPVDELAAPLVVDPLVRTGRLPNGVTWYVQVNHEPQQRAVLRVGIDAGSVLEDPDQLGLAHFVEHMAFNGTTHFPGNDLVKYLESIGTRFGPHLNAHTSFDETVYKLAVPTDDAAVFERSFEVLADWATGVTFAAEEIEKERGVVLEEWRLRRGAQGRLTDLVVPLQFHGSPYAERLPIGTEQSLLTFDPEALRRFYRTWYRPELTSVIAVGDFDPDAVQALIEKNFAGIPASPPDARPRTRPTIPPHPETLTAIFADPEMSRSSVQLTALVDYVDADTVGEWRDFLLQQVVMAVLAERLDAIAQRPDRPFLGAGAGRNKALAGRGFDQIGASTDEGKTAAGYEALLVEARRLALHGVRAAELERAKATVAKQYQTMLAQKDQEDSTGAADEIVRHHLSHEPMPGTEAEAALSARFVPTFTVEQASAWAKGWLPQDSRLVTVVSPKKDGVAVPTEEELRAIEAKVAALAIEPLPEEAPLKDLLAQAPAPAAVASRRDELATSLGFRGLVYANGITVWAKDTDFLDDEIVFAATSPGGDSKVADADWVTARLMLPTMWSSGVGQLDPTGLDRWHAGKSLDVNTTFTETHEAITGESTKADFESALSLVHAALVAPAFTEDGFRLVLEQQRAQLANREANPETHFYDAYHALVWGSDPRKQPWTVATLDQARLDRMAALHAERFGKLGPTQLVVVGDLPDDFERIVSTWVGSLPAGDAADAWVDRGKRPADGDLARTVNRGQEAKARVRLEWHGDLENTWQTRFDLTNVADVLGVMLREKLREELGGVYGVSVAGRDVYAPWDGYLLTVDFSCDPARVDELVAAAYGEIERLRGSGPEARIVDQEKEKRARTREEQLRENRFWLGAFQGALDRGDDPAGILGWDQRNAAVTVEATRDAAKRLLVDARRAKVVLLPDVAGPAPAPAAPGK